MALIRDAILGLFCKPRDVLSCFRYRVPWLAGKWEAELFGKL